MLNFDIVIVGAGFSGTLTAIDLARNAHGASRILLVERNNIQGPGVAYGTMDSQHLLNVRAGTMGGPADDPGHFYSWLQTSRGIAAATGLGDLSRDSFVPRRIYGLYLRDLLHEAQAEFPALEVRQATVTDIRPVGKGYELYDGETIIARTAKIVLALGNFPPGTARTNPYAPEVLSKLAGPGDVFLVGTGLTTLDLLVNMARTKAEGKIHVLSRSGLFPQVHEATQPYGPFLDPGSLPKTALSLLVVVRREIETARTSGIGWQSVIDAMRPLNQHIWQALPAGEQRRFLARIRSFWDTHRHRCAPEIMAAHGRLVAQGRLIRHRGAFVAMEDLPDGMNVIWKPRGAGTETTKVAFAVNCTGPQSDVRKLDDPLIQNLLKRDLLAPDALRLGADTDGDGRIRNAQGATVPGLYTIGTWRKGRLYESVAVPELRVQAAALAKILAGA